MKILGIFGDKMEEDIGRRLSRFPQIALREVWGWPSRESGVISLTLPRWKYRTLLENDGHLDNVQWVKNKNYFSSNLMRWGGIS